MGFQILGIQKFAGHDGFLLVLIRIEGGNTLLSGAVLFICQTGFLQRIQIAVPGQQQGSAVTDLQVFGSQRNTLAHHILHLDPQVFAVHGNTVAQNVDHALAEDAGRQQMQSEFTQLVDHRVTGVAAALIADDHIIVLGQQVYHAALALVTPVDAYNSAVLHMETLRFSS